MKIIFLTAKGHYYGNGHSVRMSNLFKTITGEDVTRVTYVCKDEMEFFFICVEDMGAPLTLRQIVFSLENSTKLSFPKDFSQTVIIIDKRETPKSFINKCSNNNIFTILLDSVGCETQFATLSFSGIPGLGWGTGKNNIEKVVLLKALTSPPKKEECDYALLYVGIPSKGYLKKIYDFIRINISHGGALSTYGEILLIGTFDFERFESLKKLCAAKYITLNLRLPTAQFSSLLNNASLVVTHYGITALDASKLGKPLILLHPTKLHKKLTNRFYYETDQPPLLRLKEDVVFSDGFSALSEISEDNFWWSIFRTLFKQGKRPHTCPSCGNHNLVVRFRKAGVNFLSCKSCNLVFLDCILSVSLFGKKEIAKTDLYNDTYFTTEYLATYGKSYEQDRCVITEMGKVRVEILASLLNKVEKSRSLPHVSPKLLEIGCAMGFFLDVARQRGFETSGIEISKFAASKCDSAHRVFTNNFLEIESNSLFGEDKFEVVALWYVIEHFENPQFVFTKLIPLLSKGGILAFSTPNGRGFTARFQTTKFFATSPDDHFFIYSVSSLVKMLRPMGFQLLKVRSTGIHYSRFKARFPFLSKIVKETFYKKMAHCFNLGDTFEVYFRYNGR